MTPLPKSLIVIDGNSSEDELEYIGSAPASLCRNTSSIFGIHQPGGKDNERRYNFETKHSQSTSSQSQSHENCQASLIHQDIRHSHLCGSQVSTGEDLAQSTWDFSMASGSPPKMINTRMGNRLNSTSDILQNLTTTKVSHVPTRIIRTPSPRSELITERSSGSLTTERALSSVPKKRLRNGSTSGRKKRSRQNTPETTNFFPEGDHDTSLYQIVQGDDAWEAISKRWRRPTENELRQTVVEIIDEEEDEIIEISNGDYRASFNAKAPRRLDEDDLVIDLDEEEDVLYRAGLTIEDLQISSRSRSRASIAPPPRNQPVTHPWESLESVVIANGMSLKLGKIVELLHQEFLRIIMILRKKQTKEIILRGHRLQRTRDLNGTLPRKLNELCWIFDVDLDDKRNDLEQSVVEVSLDDVVSLKQLRITNQPFPTGSFRDAGGYCDSRQVEREAPYTVRWKYSCTYRNAKDRFGNSWVERCLEHLRVEDLPGNDSDALAVSDAELRHQYRGLTIRGGAHRATRRPGIVTPEWLATGLLSPRFLNSVSNNYVTLDDGETPGSPTCVRKQRLLKERSRLSSKNCLEQIDFTDEVNFKELEDETRLIGQRMSDTSLIVADQGSTLSTPSQVDYTLPLPRANLLGLRTQQLSSVINLCGSSLATPPSNGVIRSSGARVLTPLALDQIIRRSGQKYTYGDCFCGAGGATRGALMAGLKPMWGFDADDHACSSWKLNFPDATLHKMWADQFIQLGLGNSDMKVDILHLSPPCQFFSPAHTVEGQHDEMNSASLFACGYLLDVAKPRIATLEQTFGIVLLPRFHTFFNSLVQMFTAKGYSVRWKIAHLQDWGLPQRRQRLIMIASCPGEVLPDFPPFTHADPQKLHDGLKPWVSVCSVLNGIPHDASNHNLADVKKCNLPPWSAESIAPRCITTHGGQNYHPSGKRGFTNREFAALQGFPHSHLFSAANVKKQIGNAVPPLIAKVLFEWIKKALKKADGVEPECYIID